MITDVLRPRRAPGRRLLTPTRVADVVVWVVVIVPAAVVAVLLQRHGQSWGDDFALYLRQARSLVDGDVGQVIADNRVNVLSAAKPGFSPYVYPWTFPMLLAPFVRVWGLDLDRLKLVEVACWCGFLACWWGVLRRRMADWLAIVTTAAAGWSLVYLQHTDSILSELPFLFALALALWTFDRCRDAVARWDLVDRRRLVALGVLMMLVFNLRREGLAIVPALAAMQLADVWPHRRHGVHWRAIATPHVAFVAAVVALQLALPSALAPEYDGAGLGQTWRKLRGPFQRAIVEQLGFDHLDAWVRALALALVAAGVVVRLRRHAARDAGIAVVAVGTVVIAGMIPADSDRYTMAATPLLAYFAVQALAALPRSRAVGGALLAGVLVVANVADVPDAVTAARDADRAGTVQIGPMQATSQEMFAAVERYTHHDDLVAFFKARAMTLYTERRAVQSKDLDVILQRADWFVMGRSAPIGIPILTDAEAAAAGLQRVWSNDAWTLWRVPRAT